MRRADSGSPGLNDDGGRAAGGRFGTGGGVLVATLMTPTATGWRLFSLAGFGLRSGFFGQRSFTWRCIRALETRAAQRLQICRSGLAMKLVYHVRQASATQRSV